MRPIWLPALLMAAGGALFPAFSGGQDKLPIKFGKISAADFNLQSPLIDSSTSAVVVADVGTSEFISNPNDHTFSLLFKRKKRIHILNKRGFDEATFEIPLYVSRTGKPERLDGLEAHTYNLVEGKVKEVKLERSSIFTEKRNDNWEVKKFTLPAVQEGSIIEVQYEIKSDYYFNLQAWRFQGEHPVLWSQYEARIPEFFDFVILSQGYHPFAVNKKDQSMGRFAFVERSGVLESSSRVINSAVNNQFYLDGMINYYNWVMKDVPALKEEPFTTTINNAVAKIEFQLKEIRFPNSPPRAVMNTWAGVTDDLMADDDFGLQINRPNNWLDDEVEQIIKGATKQEEQVRRLFEHLRDHYTCNNYNRYRISTSLKDVVKNKAGSVADINMLLIAMLHTIKIEADPVLLSTRSNGYVSEYYPMMDRYNYLIARVKAGENVLYLDASTPRLGFNRLPLKVYNGQARIISKNAEPVYFVSDSLLEASSTMVFVEENDKGGLSAFYTRKMGYYQSLRLRDQAASSGKEGLVKEIRESLPEGCTIAGEVVFDSLSRAEDPVTIRYELKIDQFEGQGRIYFNPMFGEAIRKNPFNAAARFYPVEMPYLFDEIYTLNMQIPKGFAVDELPKSARIMFNENEGMFEYLISATDGTIQMRCRLVMGKTLFPNEDYQSLRDFYAFVVNKEAEQIVFKKQQ